MWLHKLQSLQDQASKLSLGNLFPQDSARRRQTRLGRLPILQEIVLATHVFTWKTINFGIPEELNSKMPLNTTGRRIQEQRKLHKKPKNLERNRISRQSYRSRAYRYNTLPGSMTSLLEFKKFKKQVKDKLMWA